LAKDPLARYLLHRSSRLERSARLRPMQPGEIMDLAMRVYQNFGWVMLRATAAPALFCFAAVVFVTQYVLPSLFQTEHANSLQGQVGEAVGGIVLGFAVGGPLFLIGLSYATGVTVHLVSDFIAGRPANESGAHVSARRSLAKLFLLNIRELFQAWAGILFAFAMLVVSALISQVFPNSDLPGFATFFAVLGFVGGAIAMPLILARHAIAPSVICLEEKKVGEAVKRSVELMKGTPWTPSGFSTITLLFFIELLLLFLIWFGAQISLGMFQAFEHAQELADWPWVGAILEKGLGLFPFFLAVWTIIPVWTTTVTLLYYERRIRLEGYDIIALAQEVWRTDRQSRFEL
jgi:hypothetical protein